LLALRAKLGIPPSAPVLGFVGRLVRDKGISELIEAFQKLSAARPDLRLLLVGGFEAGDPVSPETKAYIQNEPRIILTGYVANTASYYQLMQVLTLPSHREGFPGVSLEAQASGLPVVVSDATGVIDSIVDGVTGTMVPVGDADTLASKIDGLLADDELRRRMGEAGRQRAIRDFSPESIWTALASLYRELLGKVRTANQTRPLKFVEGEGQE
jgi:glycosyltransferase involved in cell wall biosynthesis